MMSEPKERSMAKTVAMFNLLYETSLTEEMGWRFMSLLKNVRATQGEFDLDSYIDDTAYSALAGEAASKARAAVGAIQFEAVDILHTAAQTMIERGKKYDKKRGAE